MKVVFDTNVYVSEVLTGGLAQLVIDATLAARWRVYTSDSVLDEFERVMLGELHYQPRLVALARRRIARRSVEVVLSSSRHTVPDDPKDTPILQTALAASADVLISRDKHLLSLDPYEGLRILSVASYHRLLIDRGLI